MGSWNIPAEGHYFIKNGEWLDKDEIKEQLQRIKTQISDTYLNLTISLEIEDIEIISGYYEGVYLVREVSFYINSGEEDCQYYISYWEEEKEDDILDALFNNEEIYEDCLKDSCSTIQEMNDKIEWLDTNISKLEAQFEEDCFAVLKNWFTEIAFGGWVAGHYPLKKTYKKTLEPKENKHE